MNKRGRRYAKLAVLSLVLTPLAAVVADAQVECRTTCTTVRVLRLPLIGTIYSETECTTVCLQVV